MDLKKRNLEYQTFLFEWREQRAVPRMRIEAGIDRWLYSPGCSVGPGIAVLYHWGSCAQANTIWSQFYMENPTSVICRASKKSHWHDMEVTVQAELLNARLTASACKHSQAAQLKYRYNSQVVSEWRTSSVPRQSLMLENDAPASADGCEKNRSW